MGDIARFVAEIEADIRDFERDIQRAIAMAKSLPDEIKVEIDASINEFRAKLLAAQAMAKRFEADDIDKKVDLNINPFKRGLLLADKQLNEFSGKMDKLATDIRTTGTVFANMIKGTMLSSISILVPAIASVVPALMAVLNAVGVVGGGAIGLANAFGIAGAGVVGFGAMAVSALKMVEDGTLATTKEVNNYNDALDDLQSTWQKVVQGNQAQIFNTLANAVNTAQVALKGLTPFLNGVSQSIEKASGKVLDWAKNSQTATKFFDMMGTTGVRIFDNMLSAAGSFGSGFIAVLTNLAPLTEWVSKGFSNMGKRFNEWANSVEGSQAIQNFTSYVQRNLPLIGQIFGSTFRGIFNLMKAFAPNSELIFQSLANMAGRFEEWSAKIAQSDGFQKFIDYVQQNGPLLIQTLGNIINIIINIGTAMAPFASAVLKVVEAFTQWLAKLTEAHPSIGILLGLLSVLGGAFMSLYPAIEFVKTVLIPLISTFGEFIGVSSIVESAIGLVSAAFGAISAPVMIAIGVIAALIGFFVALWNSSETVRTYVTNAFNTVRDAIMQAVMAVIGFIQDLIGQFGYVGTAMETLKTTISNAWQFIVQVIEVALQVLTPIFQAGWQALVTIVQVVWELIKAVVTIALHTLIGVITALLQLLTGDWQGAWNTLKAAGEAIWQAIVTAATNIFNILSQALSAIWQGLVTIATTIWNALKTAISTVVSAIVNFVTTNWSRLKAITTATMTTIKSFISSIWSAIKTLISSLVSTIVSKVTSSFNNMKNKVTSTMSAIRSVISSVWSAIVSVISNAISRVVSAVSNGFNRARSVATSVMNSIRSVITSAWSAIVSAITSAMSRAVSAVTSGMSRASSAVRSGVSGMVSAARSFVGQMVAVGRNLIQGMINGVRAMAGAIASAARSVVSRAVSAAKSALGIHSPSRVFMEIGNFTGEGLAIGIHQMANEVVGEVESIAKQMEKAYAPELKAINPDMNKDIERMNGKLNSVVDSDITNGIEITRPIINIKNISDLPAIKTFVEEETAKEHLQRRV